MAFSFPIISEDAIDIENGIASSDSLDIFRKKINYLASTSFRGLEAIEPIHDVELGRHDPSSSRPPTQASVKSYIDNRISVDGAEEGNYLRYNAENSRFEPAAVVTDISKQDNVSHSSIASSLAIYNEIRKIKTAPCWTIGDTAILDPDWVENVYSVGNFTQLIEDYYYSIEVFVPEDVTRAFQYSTNGTLKIYKNGNLIQSYQQALNKDNPAEATITLEAGTYIISIQEAGTPSSAYTFINWDNTGLIDYSTVYPGDNNGLNNGLMPSIISSDSDSPGESDSPEG